MCMLNHSAMDVQQQPCGLRVYRTSTVPAPAGKRKAGSHSDRSQVQIIVWEATRTDHFWDSMDMSTPVSCGLHS